MAHGARSRFARQIITLPKGPFHTEDATALESVVFCYRHSFHILYRFPASFPRKPVGHLHRGFRQRGLANGVSPFFFLKMKRKKTEKKKTEENGKKNGRTEKQKKTKKSEPEKKKKKSKKGKKWKRKKTEKTEKIGSDTVPATPFAKSRLQGSLGPSGPETPGKKSEKSLPGPEAPGPPESLEKVWQKSRVWKKSRKGPDKTFSRLSPDSRGAPRPEAPGDFLQAFTGVSRALLSFLSLVFLEFLGYYSKESPSTRSKLCFAVGFSGSQGGTTGRSDIITFCNLKTIFCNHNVMYRRNNLLPDS